MSLSPRIPNSVSEQADKFDTGFLRSLWPQLDGGHMRLAQPSYLARVLGRRSELEEIRSICSQFVSSHNQVLVYHPWKGSWNISNYAKANMHFYPVVNGFEWQNYQVTRWDRTLENGDFSQRDLYPERDLRVAPLCLGDNLKAIIIAERYEHNPRKFDVDLMVGDNFQPKEIVPMPNFIKS